MKPKRGQEGFTLVELLVTILCGTIVFAAAVTILLLGLRMNAKNTANARQQNEVRIVFSMLEEMATEGAISKGQIETDSVSGEQTAWELSGDSACISFKAEDQSIKSGESVLIDEVQSEIEYDSANSLLKVTLSFADGTSYSTTIYCRMKMEVGAVNTALSESVVNEGSRAYLPAAAEEQEDDSTSPRTEFLSILTNEIGSTGKITGTEIYYSQWYTAQQNHLSWPEDTPWCACFLSWAAAQVEDDLNSVPYFASVNDGIWGFNDMETGNGAEWDGGWYNAGEYLPVPGDFIFFNLDDDADADHVGAVFSVTGDTVFTIEGNCDGKVTVCSYCLADPSILGYGILDWKSN